MVLLFNGRINALTWFAHFSQIILILVSNRKASFQHNPYVLANINVNTIDARKRIGAEAQHALLKQKKQIQAQNS